MKASPAVQQERCAESNYLIKFVAREFVSDNLIQAFNTEQN